MGVLAGKWPHSLAFQPGGTTRAVGMGERVQLLSLVAEFQTFLESALFGVALDRDPRAGERRRARRVRRRARPGRATSRRSCASPRTCASTKSAAGPGRSMSFGAYHGADGPLFARGVREGDEVASLDAAAIGEDVAYSWMREGAERSVRSRNRSRRTQARRLFLGQGAALSRQGGEVGAFARQAVDDHPLVRRSAAARRREHRARAGRRADDRNRRADARARRLAARVAAEGRVLPSVGNSARGTRRAGSSKRRAARSAIGSSRATAGSRATRSSRRRRGTFRRATARAAPARWKARSPASKSARSARGRRSSSTSCARSTRAWCAPRINSGPPTAGKRAFIACKAAFQFAAAQEPGDRHDPFVQTKNLKSINSL